MTIKKVLRARVTLIGLALLLNVVAIRVTSAATATLRGVVVDSEGGPIGMAYVIIHLDGSGLQAPRPFGDVTLRSDNRGRFTTQLEPGFYDVCVLARAFTPDCRKVLIKDGKTHEVRASLKVDPLIVSEFGDKF